MKNGGIAAFYCYATGKSYFFDFSSFPSSIASSQQTSLFSFQNLFLFILFIFSSTTLSRFACPSFTFYFLVTSLSASQFPSSRIITESHNHNHNHILQIYTSTISIQWLPPPRQPCSQLHLEKEWKEIALHRLEVRKKKELNKCQNARKLIYQLCRSNLAKVFGKLHGLEVYRQTYSATPPSSMPSGNVLCATSSSQSKSSSPIVNNITAIYICH